MESLITEIRDAYAFTLERYPALGLDTEPFRFAIRHQALHFAKTAGKLASISEHADHGDEIDPADVMEVAAKGLINSLRLAETVGLGEADLAQKVRAILRNQE